MPAPNQMSSPFHVAMVEADAPIDVRISLQPVNIVQAAADLLWSPVLRKFRELKVRRDPSCPACGKAPTITREAGYIDYEGFCAR